MLEQTERQELDIFAERLAGRLARNRKALDRFVLEGTAVLQAGKNQRRELAQQGFFTRIWRGLTGSNKRLQAELCQNHEKAIYTLQQSIYRLAEQNSLSLELATVLNRKLNKQALAQDEINIRLQQAVLATIEYMKQHDRELEQRVDALDWVADIGQQEYRGVRYGKLSELEQIVCVVNDFYRLRQSHNVGLLRLFSALEKLGLDLDRRVTILWLGTELAAHPDLWQQLVQGVEPQAEAGYLTCADMVRKGQALQEADNYIVHTVVSLSGQTDEQEVRRNLLVKYACAQEDAMPQDTISIQALAEELLAGLEAVDAPADTTALVSLSEADDISVRAWKVIGEAGDLLAQLDKTYRTSARNAHMLVQDYVPGMIVQLNELLRIQDSNGLKGRLSVQDQYTVQQAVEAMKRLKATASR